MTDKNPWFRVYTELVDDEKIRLLAFEDRWHFIALLCCKGKGILDEPNKPLMRRKVAVKLGLDITTLDEVARRLAEVELINAETLQPLAWERRQFTSDHDRTNADRQRRFREKQKDNSSLPPDNGTVTDKKRENNGAVTDVSRLPDTDTDTDTEAEKEKDPSTDVDVRPLAAASGPAEPPRLRSVKPPCPYDAIRELYHEILPELRQCRVMTDTRKGYIRQRWNDWPGPDLERWAKYFGYVRDSAFLMGKKGGHDGRPPFECDLEWLTKPGNCAKVREGKYHHHEVAAHG